MIDGMPFACLFAGFVLAAVVIALAWLAERDSKG